MRGYPDANFRAFIKAGETLRDLGYETWNAAERELDEGLCYWGDDGHLVITDMFDRAESLVVDVTNAMSSQYLVALEGWRKSPGARLEVAAAEAMEIPVYDYEDFVINGDEAKLVYL
jgi:hypothetical protein